MPHTLDLSPIRVVIFGSQGIVASEGANPWGLRREAAAAEVVWGCFLGSGELPHSRGKGNGGQGF